MHKRVINDSLASLMCMYLTIGFSTYVESMLTMIFVLQISFSSSQKKSLGEEPAELTFYECDF